MRFQAQRSREKTDVLLQWHPLAPGARSAPSGEGDGGRKGSEVPPSVAAEPPGTGTLRGQLRDVLSQQLLNGHQLNMKGRNGYGVGHLKKSCLYISKCWARFFKVKKKKAHGAKLCGFESTEENRKIWAFLAFCFSQNGTDSHSNRRLPQGCLELSLGPPGLASPYACLPEQSSRRTNVGRFPGGESVEIKNLHSEHGIWTPSTKPETAV